MTMPVLDRGTRTPPDTLVFVPHDGRELTEFPLRLAREQAPGRIFPSIPVDTMVPRRASWVLVPCLVSLRAEFNALAPARDKASDGSIGDTAHSASSSDHNPDETGATPYEDSDSLNEVHAIDVDKDLRKSGWTMQRCVDVIVGNHRAGRDDRLQYVIFNGKIASRSWDWTWRDYAGANPHDHHAHFSARYTTAQESDTSPWGLLTAETAQQEDDSMSAADVTALKTYIDQELTAAVNTLRAEVQATPDRVLFRKVDSAIAPNRRVIEVLKDEGNQTRPNLVFPPSHPEVQASPASPGSAVHTMQNLPAWQRQVEARMDEQDAKLDQLIALVEGMATTTPPA